jgi:uncharacterized protein (DUF2235 family)
MHRLVVCCDGTWTGSAPDSNVRRLAEAYIPAPGDQPAHYVPGVGMIGLKVTSPWAQLTGAGLGRSIRDGYGWLVRNFRAGDRIHLFGFSRGAYTARSIAGMIARVGLVDRSDLGKREQKSAVRRAYARYRNLRVAPDDVTWRTSSSTSNWTPESHTRVTPWRSTRCASPSGPPCGGSPRPVRTCARSGSRATTVMSGVVTPRNSSAT